MLDRFDNGVIFFVGNEVRILDLDFRVGRNGIGEDLIESVELIFVGSGNYFGDVDY